MTQEVQNVGATDEGGLTAEEKAYFESGGTVIPKGEPDPAPEPAKVAPEPGPIAEQAQQPDPPAEPTKDAPKAETADGDPSDETQRLIKYGVLKKEREQRRALEARLAEIEAQRRRDAEIYNARLMQAMQMQQGVQPKPQQPEQPAIPDPETDIFAAQKYTMAELQALKAERQAEREASERAQAEAQRQAHQQQEYARYQQAVVAEYNRLAAERAEVDPEFFPAYEYARNKRIEQIMRDEGVDKATAARMTTQEEFNVVQHALRNRQDPTERIKRYAMDIGFKAPAASTEPAKPDAQKIEQIAKGQDANKTLSTVGTSASGRGTVGATALLEMTDKEFSAWLKKAGPDGFKAAVSRA